ncbi:MAG: protein kinase [Leptospiraceae bacterium]|nr:protein kinase [Leptospiraceae bacterium]
MHVFEGYEIKEKIHTNSDIEIYRAIDKSNSRSIIIKKIPIQNEFHPSIINLKNEYEILKYLSSNLIVKVYSFQRYSNGFFFAYEDTGGISLKQYSDGKKIPLDKFYEIAIRLAEILSEIHRKKVIHKDIRPENIIINPDTMDVKLIDFGISTRLSKEETEWVAANVLEESIQYISPELASRMNGVPGAFMSMIGSSILNQIVKEQKVLDPAIILENLNNNVRHALRQDVKEDASRDGMEICFCRINSAGDEVVFAGGHRTLYMMNGDEFSSIKGDKESIGGKQKDVRKYTNHEIKINPGVRTVLYLTTDGFQDQPSPAGKKIGSKGLQEMIQMHYSRPGLEQKKLFEDGLDLHTQNNSEPQRDDITLIGIIL